MKKCTRCKGEFEEDRFAWKNKSKGTRQSECDDCRRNTAREYYQRNREQVKAQVRNRSVQYQATNYAWKQSLACCVCGESHSACLDFHHVDPAEKEIEISTLLRMKSAERMREELRKCVVVCANCHRKVHSDVLILTEEHMQRSRIMFDLAG